MLLGSYSVTSESKEDKPHSSSADRTADCGPSSILLLKERVRQTGKTGKHVSISPFLSNPNPLEMWNFIRIPLTPVASFLTENVWKSRTSLNLQRWALALFFSRHFASQNGRTNKKREKPRLLKITKSDSAPWKNLAGRTCETKRECEFLWEKNSEIKHLLICLNLNDSLLVSLRKENVGN